MILRDDSIQLQSKVVFHRITMTPDFKRIPKYFTNNEACFLFMTKGSFVFRTPTKQLSFTVGDGLLAKCGNYYIESPNFDIDKKEENLSLVGAFFYPEIVKDFFKNDLSLSHFQTSYDALKVNIEPLLKTFVDGLNFLFDNPSIVDENLIENKLKELLILLSKSENAKSINSFVTSLFDPNDYDFEKIIHENIYSNLSLAEYSHLCNCSLSSFKRKFITLYNISPAKYFSTKKLEKATQLLSLENKMVSEIAFETGFENASHFSKVFKKKFNKTPSEYRLSQLNKELNF